MKLSRLPWDANMPDASRVRDASPRRRRQIIGASAATLLAQAVRIVGGLLVVPILLRHYGSVQYGFVALIVSLMTVFVLLESVLTPVLRNELVKAHALGSEKRIERLMTVGLTASMGLGLLTLPLLAAISLLDWAAILDVPKNLPATAAVVVGTFIGIFGACTAYADAIYGAWNDLSRLRVGEALATACGLVYVVLALQVDASPVWVIVALTIPVPAVRAFAWVWFSFNHKFRVRLSVRASWKFFSMHRASSLAFTGTQALACVASLFPLLLLNRFNGLADVSVYTVAQKIIGAPANLVVALFPALWPQLTRAWRLGQRTWLKKALVGGSLILGVGTLLVAIIAFAVGPWLLDKWTKNTLTVTAEFLALFAVFSGIQVLQSWLSTILNALGEFKYQLACYASLTAGSVIFGTAGLVFFGINGLVAGLTTAGFLFGIVPMGVGAYNHIHKVN